MTTQSTSSASPAAPRRRSALEGVHAAIAGGAASAGQGWPTSYGDTQGERHAVESTIGLAEPSLYDKLAVKGPRAQVAVRSLGLESIPGTLTPAPTGGVNVWTIAVDEILLSAMAPVPGGPPLPDAPLAAAATKLRAAGASVTDVSSGWTVLRLVGPNIRSLLEELVPIDLSTGALADRGIAQVTMANCRVILARRDDSDVPGFTLLVARDEAEHLWGVLVQLGSRYDLRAVGAAALLPTPPGATA